MYINEEHPEPALDAPRCDRPRPWRTGRLPAGRWRGDMSGALRDEEGLGRRAVARLDDSHTHRLMWMLAGVMLLCCFILGLGKIEMVRSLRRGGERVEPVRQSQPTAVDVDPAPSRP